VPLVLFLVILNKKYPNFVGCTELHIRFAEAFLFFCYLSYAPGYSSTNFFAQQSNFLKLTIEVKSGFVLIFFDEDCFSLLRHPSKIFAHKNLSCFMKLFIFGGVVCAVASSFR